MKPERIEEPALPAQIGGYRVAELLGRGGIGDVYRGTEENPRRDVAIKILRPSSIKPAVLRRFEYEAEILARLDHPNIAKILHAGLDKTTRRPYFVMELVKGRDLQSHCQEQDLDIRRKLEIFESICAGVEHAHINGIVHRDLKPQNILVSEDGRPRILDFGIARPIATTTSDGESPTPGQTREGALVGSMAWMSPEQAHGDLKAIDTRSDVYSLGLVLFQMLAGELPYSVANLSPWEAVETIAEKPPKRLGRVRSDLRGDLEAITAMALEKDPERRYPSAGAMGRDIRRFLEHQTVDARGWSAAYQLRKFAERNRFVVTAAIIAALALLTGMTLAGKGLLEARRELAKTRQEADRADQERITASEERERAQRRAKELLRLADMRTARKLEEEATRLWPCRPQTIQGLSDWIEDADELKSRLGEHRDFYQSMARGEPESVDASARYEAKWWQEAQRDLVLALERFFDSTTGVYREIQRRLEVARSVKRKTVEDHIDDWQRATQAISEHPAYDGFMLSPQLGMIPLGPDPQSGLWEFWLWESGERPNRADTTEPWVMAGDTGIILVLLPGGTFRMGSTQDPLDANYDRDAEEDASPVHAVTLDPFFMSKYEMTQGQWLRLMGVNPSYYGEEGPDPLVHPVEYVNWDECRDALNRLSLVLPTEAQWEYACRAGTETPWSSGSREGALQSYANLGDRSYVVRHQTSGVTEDWDDGYGAHSPVGRFKGNAFGLYDVHGNVREWCHDSYGSYDIPARAGDGLRLDDSAIEHRVCRSGSFSHSELDARSNRRFDFAPDTRFNNHGLRPAAKIQR